MPDDGFRYELINGDLIKMTPAGSEHGAIIMKVDTLLNNHVESYELGVVFGAETGFQISSDPDTVRAPDVAFVSAERVRQIGLPKTFWPGAPDLAVEVISPNDTYQEVDAKVAEWLRVGTKLVWVVNPRRKTVTVHKSSSEIVILNESDLLDGEKTIPGFHCKISQIFPRF